MVGYAQQSSAFNRRRLTPSPVQPSGEMPSSPVLTSKRRLTVANADSSYSQADLAPGPFAMAPSGQLVAERPPGRANRSTAADWMGDV